MVRMCRHYRIGAFTIGAFTLVVLLAGCNSWDPPSAPDAPIAAARNHTAGLKWEAISAGYRFTCGIGTTSSADSHRAYCWGTNDHGQLGVGLFYQGTLPAPTPQRVAYLTQPRQDGTSSEYSYFSTITTGSDFACGLGHTGPVGASGTLSSAFCWGNNDRGRLGINDGTIAAAFDPQPIAGGELFTLVDAGAYAACGRRRLAPGGLGQGTFCWGLTDFGQSGDNGAGFQQYYEPTLIFGNTDFLALAHGWGHVCGLNPGLYCWGFNSNGQLGDGTRDSRTSAKFIQGAPTLTSLTAGTYHTCGLTSQGEAFCWGRNDNGQLGLGTSGADQLVPMALPTKLRFSMISAGAFHTCAVTKTGAAYCWGYGGTGELGNGSFSGASSPSIVSGGLKFAAISAGDDGHNCAITASKDHQLYCWGNNDSGQLGNGAVGANAAVPALVLGGS
jgi:alpha-tubulin suppressor-like RCC1 family protein